MYAAYKEEQKKLSDIAATSLKEMLKTMQVTAPVLKSKLAEIGIVRSEPTIYKWMNDPYVMNKYQSNAFAQALNIDPAILDRMISGKVDLKANSITFDILGVI